MVHAPYLRYMSPIYSTHSPFNNCQFLQFIKSQFTTNVHTVCPPPESMHIWTCMITNCHTVSNVDGGCDRFDSHEKCISDVSYVHVALIVLQFLSVPRDKKKLYKTELYMLMGCTLKTGCLFTYTDKNCLVFKSHQINREVCSNILDTVYKLQWFQYIYVCVCVCVYIYMCVCVCMYVCVVQFDTHLKQVR